MASLSIFLLQKLISFATVNKSKKNKIKVYTLLNRSHLIFQLFLYAGKTVILQPICFGEGEDFKAALEKLCNRTNYK